MRVPGGIAAEVPISSGDEVIGGVLLLGAGPPGPEAMEFLHLAAVASLTEVAVEEAKEEVEQNLRGSFLEELRSRADELDPHEVVRRAARLGCDLARGAVVLCAELTTDRPRHVVATIAGEYPGALAQHMEMPGAAGRVYALLPAAGGDEAPRGRPLGRLARRLATRLQRHGTVGPVELLHRPGRARARDPGGRAGARRAAALRRPDRRGHRHGHLPAAVPGAGLPPRGGPLLLRRHGGPDRHATTTSTPPTSSGTLEAYLEQNCNMNATAAAIYAHRHTVAYRLDRVKELTGLDPMQSEDRERLGLGLKAYRIIAPRLPR